MHFHECISNDKKYILLNRQNINLFSQVRVFSIIFLNFGKTGCSDDTDLTGTIL